MAALAEIEDVQTALGRALTTDESDRVAGLLNRASASARAWMKCVPDPVPEDVVIVVAGMVARMFQVTDSAPEVGVSTVNAVMGPWAVNRTFSSDSTSGSPWLNRDDKRILRQYGCRGRVENVGTSRW